MEKITETTPLDFILGVLVGIYGNWLITFLDKMTFTAEMNEIFYIYLILVMGAFLTFPSYIASAYFKKLHPNLQWTIHLVLILIVFMMKHSFFGNTLSSPVDDGVFVVFSIPILCLILLFEWASSGRAHQYFIKRRWKKPIIGVLSDMGENMTNETCTYVESTPNEWKERIVKSGLKAELVTISHSFDKYVAILNPYGGVYPEPDLTNLTGLKKIMNYVKDGGVFINVADIPGYWAYDKKIKRKVDTTPPLFNVINNQLQMNRVFILTPLLKELGIIVDNVTTNPTVENFTQFMPNMNIQSERIAHVESNMTPYIPNNVRNGIDVTSFFSVPCGGGDFLFSLIFLTSTNHTQQERETIRNAIVTSLNTLIQEKINLHKK